MCKIEEYDGLSTHEAFGFLGITLAKYLQSHFFQTKRLQIGILTLDGEYDKEKYNEFLYNSSNKILMSNDEIILFKDKKKFSSSELMNQNIEEVQHNYNFISNSEKLEILTSYFKELELFVDQLKIKFFQQQFIDSLSKGVIQSIKINYKLFQGMSEFDDLEKKKILILFKIYKSFGEYDNSTLFKLCDNKKISSSIRSEPDKHNSLIFQNNKIKFEILKTNNYQVQKLIIEVLILYILSIFSKEIALRTLLNFIESNPHNFSHLKSILDIKLVFLLGFLSDLYSNLLKLKIDIQIEDNISQLEMTPLYLNVNFLKDKHRENSKIFIYQELSSIGERKKFIKNNMIQFFKEELKIYDFVINLTQHVYDYLIKGQVKKKMLINCTFQFSIFSEIRSVFFEYLNHMSGGELISALSERQYLEYSTVKFNYDAYFIRNQNKNKISTLKNIIGNVKSLREENKINCEEFINEYENTDKKYSQQLSNFYIYNKFEKIKSSKHDVLNRTMLKVEPPNNQNLISSNKPEEEEEEKLFRKKIKIPKLKLKDELAETTENLFYKLGIKSKNFSKIINQKSNFKTIENNEKSLSQYNLNKSSNFNSMSNTKTLISLQLEKFKNSSKNQESLYITGVNPNENNKKDINENNTESLLPNFSNNKILERINYKTLNEKSKVFLQTINKSDSHIEKNINSNKYKFKKNSSTNTVRIKNTVFLNDKIDIFVPEIPKIKKENLFEKLNNKLKFSKLKMTPKNSSATSINFSKNEHNFINSKKSPNLKEKHIHIHFNKDKDDHI